MKPISMFIPFVIAFGLGACDRVNQVNRIEATNISDQSARGDTGSEDVFVKRLNTVQSGFEQTYLATNAAISLDGASRTVDAALLQDYVKGRRTQINDLCQIYFEGLYKQSQTSELFKGMFSIATNTASAVMGLTGAAAQQLALLALGEAAILDGTDKVEEIYLLAPSPQIVHGLVKEAQSTFVDDFKVEDVSDYPGARNHVRNYAALCTPIEIRRMIDAAIKNSEIDFTRGASRTAAFAEKSGLQVIGNTIGADDLSESQATNLYIAYGPSGASKAQKDAAVEALGNLKIDSTQAGILKRVFAVNDLQIVAALEERAKILLAASSASGDPDAAADRAPSSAEQAPTSADVK